MYIDDSTQEKISHRALQDSLNCSFPRNKPPKGWSVYVAPEPEAAPVEVRVKIRRDEAINAGTALNGMPLDTSDTTQTRISGAVLEAMLDDTYTVNWKAGDGFVLLNAAQIIAAGQAIRAHVQACFDREAELLAMTTPTDSDINSGWPA